MGRLEATLACAGESNVALEREGPSRVRFERVFSGFCTGFGADGGVRLRGKMDM